MSAAQTPTEPPPSHAPLEQVPPRPPPCVPDHELLQFIGRGSYGEVWLARNIMGERRAVKFVSLRAFDDSERPFELEREFKGIQLYEPISRSHESLLPILHVGRDDTAHCFYYVMELADDAGAMTKEDCRMKNESSPSGDASVSSFNLQTSYFPKTLRLELQRRRRLPVDECTTIGVALTTALEQLHKNRLVHRDIKPSNIIFIRGRPKLADIGLVIDIEATRSYVGTEGYIPPEGPGKPMADLYALGKVLYEMSTGRDRVEFPAMPPMETFSLEEQERLRELNVILLKACENDLAKRYRTAADMHVDLLLLQTGKSVMRLHRLEKKIVLFRRFGILAAVFLAFGIGAYSFQQKQARRFKALADEARERVVRLHVAQGVPALEENDYLSSLAWFVGALQAEQENQEREEIHRYRIESVLQRCPKLAGFGYHETAIEYGAFCPDGSRFITGSLDGTAQLWNVSDSQRTGKSMRHEDALVMVIFSPDGTRVATACRDGTARTWDSRTGEAVSPFVRHRNLIYYVAFDSAGRRLATASKDGTARIWNALSGEGLTGELRHEDEVNMATFSPDGKALLTASDDRTARLWDATTGKALASPMRHEDHVRCAVFSPDGRVVATGSRDGVIRFWSASSGAQIASEKRLWVNVRDLRFSPDGEKLYAVGGDQGQSGELRGWHWRTGRELFKPGSFPERLSHVTVSGDGRWLLTTGGDAKVRVFDAIQGSSVGPVITQPKPISMSAFDPHSGVILTTSLDGTWRIWDWTFALKNDAILEHQAPGVVVGFRGQGKQVLVGSPGGIVTEYDVESRRMVRQLLAVGSEVEWFDLARNERLIAGIDRSGSSRVFDLETGIQVSQHENQWPHVTGLFDHSEKRLIEREGKPPPGTYIPRSGYALRVWDVATGENLLPPLFHSNFVWDASISPDDRLVATSCGDRESRSGGYVRIWDLRTGQPVTEPLAYRSTPVHVEFSHNGQFLLINTTDEFNSPGTVEIRTTTDWRIVGKPVRSPGGFEPAMFSPDGKHFFAADSTGTARIYDTLLGQAVSQVMPHGRGVTFAGFSPDGRRIVTSSVGGFLRWWDARNGEPITPLLSHGRPKVRAWSSPDGKTLISTGSDNLMKVWRLTRNSLAAAELGQLAQLITGRKLDAAKGSEAIPPSELFELWRRVGKLQAASEH